MESGILLKKFTKEQILGVSELQNDNVDEFREFRKFTHTLTCSRSDYCMENCLKITVNVYIY